MYNMLSQVSQGNYLIMTFAADESKYNNFFSTLTSSCGWNDIREDECALVGCCWNSATSVCENPLGTNISQERIQFAIQHVTLRNCLKIQKILILIWRLRWRIVSVKIKCRTIDFIGNSIGESIDFFRTLIIFFNPR